MPTNFTRRQWMGHSALLASASGVMPALLSPSSARAVESKSAEWPQMLGPRGDSRVEAELVTAWSETSNIFWRAEVPGKGWSSPVVGDDVIWVTTAPEEGGVFIVLGYDWTTGRQNRRVDLFPKTQVHPINTLNSYASPTPTLRDGRLYVSFGRYGTACIEAATGKVVWQRNDITLDHGEGPGSSPAVWQNRMFIACDGKDSQFVIALDTETGETAWKTNRSLDLTRYDAEMRKAFATPMVANIGGRATLISQGAHAVYGYDPESGEEWWKVEHPEGFSTVCVPMVRENLLVLATGYMKPQLWGIQLGGSGPDTKSEIVWRHTSNCPNMPSPVIDGDLVFTVTDNGGIASCLALATGKVQWTQRIGGNYSATPLVAGGKLYLFDRDSRTTVLAADKKYSKLGENRLHSGCMASPAVVNQSLILRAGSSLYRIEAV